MYSFLLTRPRDSRPNPETYESCVVVDGPTITTKEKYPKKCAFSDASQIQTVNDHMYGATLRPHLKTMIRNSSGVARDHRSGIQVMTVIGFGVSGSGKTYSLLGMDSSGTHNKDSLLRGVIGDLGDAHDKSISIEITQVYCNQVLVLCERQTTSYSHIMSVITESFKLWKQQKLRTHNSSRAHLCIRLMCKTHEVRIIDTAGFEKPDDEREHKETVHINRDMLAMKECIRKIHMLSKKPSVNGVIPPTAQPHIPYRQRTLTNVLFRDTKFKHGTIADHTIFVFGAIDPYASSEECAARHIEANPKHPRLATVTNTLQYISMIGGADLTTMKREKPVIPAIIPVRRPRSNSVPDNVSPRQPIMPPKHLPALVKVSESSVERRHKRLVKRMDVVDVVDSSHGSQQDGGSPKPPAPPAQNPPPVAPPRTTTPSLPPQIMKYIHNQMTLLDRFLKYDYSTQYREVMETVNDQQVLASNILLDIVYDVSNAREFGTADNGKKLI